MAKTSFAGMKKSKQDFGALAKKLEETSTNSTHQADDRFYYPARDKTGNGYAVIRFLPAPDGEDVPWVKRFSHGFKGTGGWYIEECHTTLGNECPVCNVNSELVNEHGKWDQCPDHVKKTVRDRKRRLQYYANIVVVEDSENPEFEGKVMLFKFGSKIFDKIMGAVKPDFKDETPIDPFDLWEGANFKLKIRKVDNMTNYDKSEFDTPSQLAATDGELEAIWNQEVPLLPFIAESEYLDYDEAMKKVVRVLKLAGGIAPKEVAEEKSVGSNTASKFESKAESAETPDEPTEKAGADEDAMAYFEQLANES